MKILSRLGIEAETKQFPTLAKRIVDLAKKKELNFSKEEIEYIEKTVKVTADFEKGTLNLEAQISKDSRKWYVFFSREGKHSKVQTTDFISSFYFAIQNVKSIDGIITKDNYLKYFELGLKYLKDSRLSFIKYRNKLWKEVEKNPNMYAN